MLDNFVGEVNEYSLNRDSFVIQNMLSMEIQSRVWVPDHTFVSSPEMSEVVENVL